MALSVQDALVQLMVIAASSDANITEAELARIDGMVSRWPVFVDYDHTRLPAVANQTIDGLNGVLGLEGVIDRAIAVLPKRLQDTAYALVVEVAAVDLALEQEELRFLEMIRDRLEIDRLITAAIEATARAKHRRLEPSL